jgi:hypothetical protein
VQWSEGGTKAVASIPFYILGEKEGNGQRPATIVILAINPFPLMSMFGTLVHVSS